MNNFWRTVLLGMLAVLVFDTLAAFAAKMFAFPYVYASAGSAVIYGIIGYQVYRSYGWGMALGAALLVELVDASLGWYIAWQLGPGAVAEPMTLGLIAVSILFALPFAAVFAALGALVARTTKARH